MIPKATKKTNAEKKSVASVDSVSNPVGRPTKYEPNKCDTVIRLGKEGGAIAEMAVACDISISTLYLWAKEHVEFSEALERAQSESEAWWASHIRGGLEKVPSEFQGPANLKYMGIRFQERWADRTKIEHSGRIDGARFVIEE